MEEAHNIPKAVQWHEGMLLAPQHFQQFAFRQEELLHYHLMNVAPFYWGIRRLKVDQALLIDGTLRILDLEAVMPDGIVVYHLHPEEKNLEIDLTPHLDELQARPLSVHLVIPAIKAGNASVPGALARYDSVEGKSVTDENTGESELSIPRLRPRLGLLIAETPPQKYSAFPLLQVAYRNETFTLTDFITPTLKVALRSPLGEICAGICHRLREKALFLSERVQSPSTTLRGPMILETKILIQNMVTNLVQFEAVLNSGASHPYVLYLSLCGLVGSLAGLGLDLIPPSLEPYNHNDLRATYLQTQNYLFRMVDEGILETHTAIPFDFESGAFNLKLDTDWLKPKLIIGVRGRPAAAEKEILNWMNEGLIGSSPKIESMKSRRILGAERNKIEGDEQLVPSRGVVLYEVKAQPAFIEPDEILQILNTADPSGKQGPAEIVLYVKNEP